MYIIKECPIEKNGQIGFRTCSDGETQVLMCDECGAVWLHPEKLEVENAIYPIAPLFIIVDKVSVAGACARWATLNDIEKRGWAQYITRTLQALDE